MHPNALFLLTSLVSLALAGHQHPAPVAQRMHKRFPTARHHRRALTDPSNLAAGSLTTAEGCGKFYSVQPGEYCYKLVARFKIDSLADFYSMNPEVDADCQNLWAGRSYCVRRNTTAASNPDSDAASTTTSNAAKSTAVAVKKVDAQPTTTSPPAATTTPAAVAKDGTSSSSDDDDEWVCDATTEESSSSSTTTQAPAVTTQKTKAKVQVQTTTPAAAQTSTTSTASTSTGVSDVTSFLSSIGVKGFPVKNGPAIGSWYDADSSQDSTNGHSWCYFPYNDNTPGIAISYNTMMADGNGSNQQAGEIYCGLEVLVTAPNGNSATLVIADAFDDSWIRETGSIDIMHGAFTQLYGSYTDNKDDVIEGITWKFTGGRNEQYKFNGAGN